MATSVKMDGETKSKLERLQAEIKLRTDRKVTQQEILSRLVDRAIDSKAELIDSFREDTLPFDAEEKAAFHEGMIDSGKATSEEDIDEILYG